MDGKPSFLLGERFRDDRMPVLEGHHRAEEQDDAFLHCAAQPASLAGRRAHGVAPHWMRGS